MYRLRRRNIASSRRRFPRDVAHLITTGYGLTMIIRIFNGCEVLIENSVTRVTVRHHEACRVMPNSYSSDEIFSLHWRTIMDYCSCILDLGQLHLDLNMCCFYQVYAKITTYMYFDQGKFGTSPLICWRRNFENWRQNWRQNRHTDVMHESTYTPM